MKKMLIALLAASVCGLTACSETTKDTAKSEETHKGPDGKEVKTQTTVEKKTTTDK